MYDLIIRGGLIVDGTGKDAYHADIAVKGDKIVKIGDLTGETAEKVIDAAGCCVTPGFIDPHSHADMSMLIDPSFEAYLMQGVTTVVGGNCGHAAAPMDKIYRSLMIDTKAMEKMKPHYFGRGENYIPREEAAPYLKETYGFDLDWHSFKEYNDKLNTLPLGANMAPLIGHSLIRTCVMGMDYNREATEEEIEKMVALTEQCMREGAFGFSTGRDPHYLPSSKGSSNEIIRMLKVVKKYGGVFASHTANYDKEGKPDRMGGYREMIEQAKAADIRTNVSHVHTLGMADTAEGALKAAQETIEYFEQCEREGVDITYDVIPSPFVMDFTVPYGAYWLRSLVLISGSAQHLAENLRVPDFRKMVRYLTESDEFMKGMAPGAMIYKMLIIERHKNPAYVGKFVNKLAEEYGKDELEMMMDIFMEDPYMGANTSMAGFEEANDLLCRHRMAMPCADGFSFSKDYNFGINDELVLNVNAMTVSFMPRFILRHAKDRFEDTIRQITGFVAERFNIDGRGVIVEGNFADLVVLNRDTLHSYDRDENPMQYPEGFEHVIVNGVHAVEHKKLLGTGGRVLSKV